MSFWVLFVDFFVNRAEYLATLRIPRVHFANYIFLTVFLSCRTRRLASSEKKKKKRTMLEEAGELASKFRETDPGRSSSVSPRETNKDKKNNYQRFANRFRHCPENINNVLKEYGDSIVIDDPISLDNPYIKFTYVPDPPNVTIRKVLEQIKQISPQFETKIVHPMSLEERSMLMTKKEQRKIVFRLILTFVVAIPTFILGIVGMSLLPTHNHFRIYLHEPMWVGAVSRVTWANFFLATPVYFFADDLFHVKAFKEVASLWRTGVPWTRRLFKFGSMNLLMSLGTSIAYFASIALLILSARTHPGSEGFTTTFFDSVVFLTFFLLIGRLLDSISKSRTASAVSLLGNLRPSTVQLIEQFDVEKRSFGDDQTVSLDLVEAGDFVRIQPGMACAVDGIVFDGESSFDESALTGESMPVKHGVGDQVYAGTVNNGGCAVVVKITAIEGDSLLDSIVAVVKEGQLHRAPVERVAQRITGVFVPVVTLLAVLTWIIWLSLGLSGSLPDSYLDIDIGGWTIWSLQFAVAVFVIACPCGIGLAAPTALYMGSGLAAKYGVLARGGGEAFQEGSKVNIVCFDKTGTLTEGGEPKVVDEQITSTLERAQLLHITRDLELNSGHPLATAVRSYCEDIITDANENWITGASEVSGRGVKGRFKDASKNLVEAYIGNEKFMAESGAAISDDLSEKIHRWKTEGKSVMLLALKTDDTLSVHLALSAADKIRDESKAVVEELTKRGIECWLISGDNETTAKAVAQKVSIPTDHVISEVLPQEKSDKIQWLQKSGNSKKSYARAIVAMVGDGVNDAPSLTMADVGIAIGSGSDIALSSAEFVLLKSDLNAILILIEISKTVFNRVKFNFFWALIYNCIGIPIAAGVIYPYNNSRLDPVWASLAMALSSVSVVVSSLLLKFYRPKKIKQNKH